MRRWIVLAVAVVVVAPGCGPSPQPDDPFERDLVLNCRTAVVTADYIKDAHAQRPSDGDPGYLKGLSLLADDRPDGVITPTDHVMRRYAAALAMIEDQSGRLYEGVDGASADLLWAALDELAAMRPELEACGRS